MNASKNEPLTDEQIKNWRITLSIQYGPYAMVMPREQIQILRDKMQAWADEEEKKIQEQKKVEEAKKGPTLGDTLEEVL